MLLLRGMSTRRYLPAKGTAGLQRSLVKGNSRSPLPPPSTTPNTSEGLALISASASLFSRCRAPCGDYRESIFKKEVEKVSECGKEPPVSQHPCAHRRLLFLFGSV